MQYSDMIDMLNWRIILANNSTLKILLHYHSSSKVHFRNSCSFCFLSLLLSKKAWQLVVLVPTLGFPDTVYPGQLLVGLKKITDSKIWFTALKEEKMGRNKKVLLLCETNRQKVKLGTVQGSI